METAVYTVDEMAEEIGIVLDSDAGKVLASGLRYLASTRSEPVSKKRKRFKDDAGSYQSYNVSAFDYRYISDFERLAQGLNLL